MAAGLATAEAAAGWEMAVTAAAAGLGSEGEVEKVGMGDMK